MSAEEKSSLSLNTDVASQLDQSIRLLTINTWKCDGAYLERMDQLERNIRSLSPDIICCQEVFQSFDERFDTGRCLADRLGLQFKFLALRKKRRHLGDQWLMSYSGLAVLSRWNIAKHTAIRLPTLPEDGERSAFFVVLAKEAQSILIINTHLTHLPTAKNTRIAQLETILAQQDIRAGHDAVFLCGDFNAPPDSTEVQYLLNHPTLAVRDTLALPSAARPGITFPVQGSFGMDEPHHIGKRIDYIFNILPPGAVPSRIIDARIVLDQPSPHGIFPSDHYGVMIETVPSRGET